jgi:AMP nucleosidase
MHHRQPLTELPLISPPQAPDRVFNTAGEAVADLQDRYGEATGFLRARFGEVMAGKPPEGRYRAFYPSISLTTASFAKVDSRLSFGHVTEPGVYETTITRPDLFAGYLTEQIGLLIQNHGMPVRIGTSDTPIPLHFAMGEDAHVEGSIPDTLHRPLRDLFDVPDLNVTDDHIVNGNARPAANGARPLAPFTAQRVDYSLARLAHYTATSPTHFQNHVLFTNYQFYMDEFVEYALSALADPESGYTAFVEPGNAMMTRDGRTGAPTGRLPQMPAFHLIRPRNSGISMVNIGVGPSNAKTITDHIAVLRPHVWLMVGHCAGRCETSSTCRISPPPTTTSSTAAPWCRRGARGRWRRSPPSASTIRWRGWRITRRPARPGSRTTCCSPTTSSTWTSSWTMPWRRWPTRHRATRPSWSRATW